MQTSVVSEHHTAGQSGGTHAIVIGGGAAGLLVARDLACRFARVTIIERDQIAAHLHDAPDQAAAYLREHGLPIERVRLIQGCEVTGILFEGASQQATGVRIRLQPGRWVGTACDPWRELRAERVIDTRRSHRSPQAASLAIAAS
jgi:ribulose 1,5-bisphosphate synthetase/thiazole synthase